VSWEKAGTCQDCYQELNTKRFLVPIGSGVYSVTRLRPRLALLVAGNSMKGRLQMKVRRIRLGFSCDREIPPQPAAVTRAAIQEPTELALKTSV
jgi:hypothetical protein